jgi:hypothetical protein
VFPKDYPKSFEEFWTEAVRRGFVEEKPASKLEVQNSKLGFPQDLDKLQFPEPRESPGLHLVAFPHIALFDGRGANKPWLQELPETITQITWDTWVEIHPELPTSWEFGMAKRWRSKAYMEESRLRPSFILASNRRPSLFPWDGDTGDTAGLLPAWV